MFITSATPANAATSVMLKRVDATERAMYSSAVSTVKTGAFPSVSARLFIRRNGDAQHRLAINVLQRKVHTVRARINRYAMSI
ncbi:MAG TPA: hypothetical protein VF088_01070, partial [Pyrinomonadaceae bacterium]